MAHKALKLLKKNSLSVFSRPFLNDPLSTEFLGGKSTFIDELKLSKTMR